MDGMLEGKGRDAASLALPCLSVICIVALLSTLYYRLSLITAVLFLIIYFGGTFCSGRILLRVLKADESLISADVAAFSYELGYVVSIVLYAVFFALGALHVFKIFFLLFSVLCIAACAKMQMGGSRLFVPDESSDSLLRLFLVLLAVYVLTFMLPNYLPIGEANGYYLDNVFWVGNNIELTYSMPPDNFRNVLAPNIRYHYLSSIRMAAFQTVLEIPAFEACFAYSFFDLAILLASAGTMFVHEFIGESTPDSLPFTLATFLLLFSTGLERLTSMSYISHLYIASFGFCESFAALFIFLSLAKRYWELGHISVRQALLSSIMLALCMSHKGSFGFVCLMVAFVICSVSLFQPQRRQFALLFGLTALVAGIMVYYTFLSEGIWRTVGDVSNVKSILSYPKNAALYGAISVLPLPRACIEVLFLAAYTCLCHPICWVCGVAALVQAVRGRTLDLFDMALLLTTVVCIAILRAVPMKGFSQSYFFMVAVPLVWGFVFRRLRIPATLSGPTQRMAFVACVSAISIVCCYQAWLPKLVIKDMRHLTGQEMSQTELAMPGFDDNYVTPESYEALVWVRDNLPREALYMVDAYDEATRNTYYPGAISERHVIMQWNLYGITAVDFSDDAPSVFKGDESALEQCRVVGVDYLIRLSDGLDLMKAFPNELEIVYSSDGACVYRVI